MVTDIAAQVEQVLVRAASLFAAPAVDHLVDIGGLRDAVTTVRVLQSVGDPLGGEAGESVKAQAELTLAVLSETAHADEALLSKLQAVAAAHGRATAEANHVLAQSQETLALAPELALTPAGEVAVLRQLRGQVATMARLLSEERRHAAQVVSGGDSAAGEMV